MTSQIKISTVADLKGFKDLESAIDRISSKAQRVSDIFGGMGAGRIGGGTSGASGNSSVGSPSTRRRQSASPGQQYNLNTPGGVTEYMENVLSQVPSLRSIGNGNAPSTGSVQTLRRKSNSLQDVMGVKYASTTTSDQSFGSRMLQHFGNNLTGGRTVGSALMGGVKGAAGGSIIDAVAGGGETGAALGGLGAASIGEALGGPIGAIAALALKAVGSAISQGVQSFQQTMPSFSALGHSMDNAKKSVDNFRYNTQMAGAKQAMTPEQSTQVAQTLVQGYGNSVGMKGITNLVSQTGAAALINGIDPSTMASISALAAALGITNGVGSTMNNSSFNQMLLNMTSKSHMQGRQQQLYTGLESVYSGLQSVNPIISAQNSTAAIYTAMNASGIQGLQGSSGASILSQMNSTLGSGQGLAGIMGMSAIEQASGGKITNPWQMQSIMEQGLGAKVGNTTYGKQLLSMVKGMGGGNTYTEAGLLSSIAGISVNQAMAMLKSGAMGASSISEKNNTSTNLTATDKTTAGTALDTVRGSGVGAAENYLKSLGASAVGAPSSTNINGKTTSMYSPSSKSAQNAASNSKTSSDTISPYGLPSGISKAKLTAIMESIAYQESTGNPYAINDNTDGDKNVSQKSLSAYLAKANQLKGKQLALGTFQLDTVNKGITPAKAVNQNWAAQEALTILLSGQNSSSVNWNSALWSYSGHNPGYAGQVISRANQYASNPNLATIDLSPATIQAIENAIDNLLARRDMNKGKGPSH